MRGKEGKRGGEREGSGGIFLVRALDLLAMLGSLLPDRRRRSEGIEGVSEGMEGFGFRLSEEVESMDRVEKGDDNTET